MLGDIQSQERSWCHPTRQDVMVSPTAVVTEVEQSHMAVERLFQSCVLFNCEFNSIQYGL
jgi:hypothetical protein